MQTKIDWMVEQARLDDISLDSEDIGIILATQGGVGIFSDAEVDYVLALDEEWRDQ